MANINTTNISSILLPLADDGFSVPRNQHKNNILVAMIVLDAVIAALASCSNAVVIYTISRTPSLQTPSNILILGLAISDFSLGVFVQPFDCVSLFAELENDQNFYYWSNLVFQSSAWTLALVSILTLTMVIADRFLAIHLHLRYQELITVKRYVIVLAIIWFISPWFGVYSHMSNSNRNFFHVSIAVLSILTILNGYFIFKIRQAIRRHSLQIHVNAPMGQDMPRHKKSVKTMYLMIGSFVLCYGPFSAIMVASEILDHAFTLSVYFDLFITLVMSNSVMNPTIYFWRIEEMLNAAPAVLQKIYECGNVI